MVQTTADPDDEVRQWATAALEQLGPPRVEQLTSLITALEGPSPDIVYWAATLLGRMGPDAALAVGPLTRLLESSAAAPVYQRAAWALGKIGSAAAPAIDALEQAASGSDPRLARLAGEAL